MQPPRVRFTPVQLKARHDGWTAARQRRFIDELAATKSIARACRAVRMSRMSAYKLRDHSEAAEFRRAWERALEPDCVAERRRSPRALQRLARLEKRRKVYEAHETDEPPNSPAAARSTSLALTTLETYLALLRAQGARAQDCRGQSEHELRAQDCRGQSEHELRAQDCLANGEHGGCPSG